MIFKSYFDGGNEANSSLYEVVCLSTVSGNSDQWRGFERDWKEVLKKHGAPFLHTTDAVSLKKSPFIPENGWNKTRRDEFLSDCVTALEKHIAVHNKHGGLVPYVVTIVLKDFLRAAKTHPRLPRDATELLATQAIEQAVRQGTHFKADFFHWVFDQNEPFKGHIDQRMQNRKASRHLKRLHDRVVSVTEADMRHVAALQLADLIGWCVTHKLQAPRHRWQNRVLRHSRQFDDWKDYDKIIDFRPGAVETITAWELPKHRATR